MSYLIKHNYIKWNYDALMLVNILLKFTLLNLNKKQEQEVVKSLSGCICF